MTAIIVKLGNVSLDEDPLLKDLPATELMEQKLRSEPGRERYKLLSQTVEPVFG